MRSIKFLSALAVSAMFAACTNEEIVVETPQQMQEVIGAELLGPGITINVGDGAQSRLLNGSWQNGDKLGLGWIVYGDYTKTQVERSAPNDNKLFANHMFEYNDKFSTKGNVYVGWHFAYWPFSYMSKIDNMKLDVNPMQSKAWAIDREANAFHVSARNFLATTDLDENYQLKGNKVFEPVKAVNEIVVLTTPKGGFVDNAVLNARKIKSVELDMGKETFYTKGELAPVNLPTNKYDVNGVYDKEATIKAVSEKLYAETNAAITKGKATKSIKTIIDTASEEVFVTGQAEYLRLFTMPTNTVAAATKNVSIKIEVETGYFTVTYDGNAVEGSDAAVNNKAIEALIAAVSKDGYTYTNSTGTQLCAKLNTVGSDPLALTLNLYEDIFEPYFGNIASYPEWKQAVDLVNALGTYNEENVPEFTITGNIEVTDKAIYMPANCGIVVKSKNDAAIVTKATMTTWPENLDASEVDVVIDSNVTLPVPSVVKANSIRVNEDKKLTLKGGKTSVEGLDVNVTNYGTVVVNKNAKVEDVDNYSRIEVVYGSYVTTTANKGIVAYVLTGSDKAYQINYLIDTENNEAGFASVNTLVVNSGKTLNLGLTDPAGTGFDDPYNPVVGANPIELEDLSNINVEMNGGSIVGVHDGKQSVGIVYVKKGTTNTMMDVIPAEVEIAAKATLGIDASKDINGVKYELNMPNTEFRNLGGTLNVEAMTHINILHNIGTVDATGYKLHSYTESDTNAGKTIGDVKLCDCNPVVEMSQYGEDIKNALDTFNAGQAQDAQLKTYEALAKKLNDIVADLVNAKSWGSYIIYQKIETYYDAVEKEVPSQFTAVIIAKIEGDTGVEFGLE